MPQGRVIDPEGQQSPGQGWGYIARNDKSWPNNPSHNKPDERKTIPFYNPKKPDNSNKWKDGDPVKFKVRWAKLTLNDGETFLDGKIGIADTVEPDPS